MVNLFFKDNNQGVDFNRGLKDKDTSLSEDDSKVTISSLDKIANKSLLDLSQDNPNLLVFPTSFNIHNDDIEKSPIFNLYSDNKLQTYNLMGFVGKDDVCLTIGSRFDAGEEKQYFMQYMLQKVFAINLVDLSTNANNENIWDFLLMYMFPNYLNKALNQGLYKEYRKVKHNDANVKGTIDIARHVKLNRPFTGNVAYNTREFSYDNPTTQLIRHTIEYITNKGHGNALNINSDTIDNLNQIREATPTYNIRERQSVIQNNYKKVKHPFFTEYEYLRIICQKILHQDGLSMQNNENKVHGLLFDGAWLWEEYLNTLLKDLDYLHPENKTGKGRIYLFENNKYSRYPDFYKKDKTTVIDAKYKNLKDSTIDRDDMHQIISYLFVLKANKGYLMYPKSENKTEEIGILNGYDASIFKYEIAIPDDANDFKDFSEKMMLNENELILNFK
jgi:5-methylcytosine-specific restriction endonuclease McrBC regulatory subunit McrC